MKKRIVTLLLVLILAVSSLAGCSSSGSKTQITQSSTTLESSTTLGNYFLYETSDRQEYLNFLQTLDTSKYEIVDISISCYGRTTNGDYLNHYNVTYRTIEK